LGNIRAQMEEMRGVIPCLKIETWGTRGVVQRFPMSQKRDMGHPIRWWSFRIYDRD